MAMRDPSTSAEAPSTVVRGGVIVVALLVCSAALILHAYPILRPSLSDDDFFILARSWTWAAAWENVWVPNNEHAMPLGRLSTAAIVQLGGGAVTAMPRLTAWQGPIAVVLGMVLAGQFVGREMGHPFYGLLAMTLFGVSLKYNEAVFWFAASFAVLALDTTVLALLAAQRWRQTGRTGQLLLCTFWCAMAPCWFASGVLAGPLCSLYLLWGENAAGGWRRRVLAAMSPLLGSAVFVGLGLTFAAEQIVRAEHHGGRSALQVFNPIVGLEYTARTFVDSLVLGTYAATGKVAPTPVLAAGLAVLALVAGYWWRVAAQRRLMVVGLGMIFLNYGLIYSFRAEGWSYEDQIVQWTRYHAIPFLGLVLFFCGGLPSREGSLFQLVPGGLTLRQAGALVGVASLLLGLQLAPALQGHHVRTPDPEAQMATLRLIEDTDAQCLALRIDAATARAALGTPLVVPQMGNPRFFDGWELLRGSADPLPMSADEARRLLKVKKPGT